MLRLLSLRKLRNARKSGTDLGHRLGSVRICLARARKKEFNEYARGQRKRAPNEVAVDRSRCAWGRFPDLPIMTYEEFFVERQEARYSVGKGRIKGCC